MVRDKVESLDGDFAILRLSNGLFEHVQGTPRLPLVGE